jgi:hypothetical protein
MVHAVRSRSHQVGDSRRSCCARVGVALDGIELPLGAPRVARRLLSLIGGRDHGFRLGDQIPLPRSRNRSR